MQVVLLMSLSPCFSCIAMGCVSSGDNFYHKMGSKIVVGNVHFCADLVYVVLPVFEGHNIYEASS